MLLAFVADYASRRVLVVALALSGRGGQAWTAFAGKEISAEIAEAVADRQNMDLAARLAWGRALHAAAAICFKRGDKDAELLHDMVQTLIGLAFDRLALTALPTPGVRH